MQKKRPKPLYIAIAEKVQARIETNSCAILPSIKDLSRDYSVSSMTMMKSLRYLREKKILEYSQGKRIRVSGRSDPHSTVSVNPTKKISAEKKMFAKMKENIETGTWRVGHVLPKMLYFIMTEHISATTVCTVYTRLAEQGYIHKEGKQWIVGPAKKKMSDHGILSYIMDTPRVLLLFPSFVEWKRCTYQRSSYGQQFVQGFLDEIDVMRMQFTLVLESDDEENLDNFISGKKKILSHIQELKKNYAGVFIVGHKKLFKDLTGWISWFLQFKQPVCWYDSSGADPQLDRRTISNTQYFRFSYSLESMVRSVVALLHETGHTRICMGIPKKLLEKPWPEERVQLIRKEMTGKSPSMTFSVKILEEKIWCDDSVLTEPCMIDWILSLQNKYISQFPGKTDAFYRQLLRKELMRSFSTMAGLLKEQNCTALITPNKLVAVHCYFFFRMLGVSIPRNLSIISFDNFLFLRSFPISTIDMKFGNLGYKAARIFIGDVPVKHDRHGNVTNQPELVDAGSVGPPRRGQISFARNIGGEPTSPG